MIYYKVRRKSDGKFARNYHTRSIDGGGWGVGQAYSERAFRDVVRLYNSIGGRNSTYVKDPITGHYNSVPVPQSYDQLELVKFGPGGEVIVWAGSRCTMTPEEAAKITPDSQRQAGIQEEIGDLLEQIEAANLALDAKKIKGLKLDKLFADIEFKDSKLKAAIEELAIRTANLRERINSIMEQ